MALGEYPKPSIRVSEIENPGISGGVSGVSVPSECGGSGGIKDAPPIGLFAHSLYSPYDGAPPCDYVTLADGELVEMFPPPDASFFSSHPVYSLIKEVQEDGNHFVYIPRFYCAEFSIPDYGSGQLISYKPLPGFSLHRAFYDSDGNEVKGILVSKYLASDEGGVAVSKPGNLPVILGDDWDYVTSSMLNDYTDYRVLNYADWNALRMLVSIEYGNYTLRGFFSTGATNLGYSYCLPVDDPIVAEISWRGIVGLWGNAFIILPEVIYDKFSYEFHIECNGLNDYVESNIGDNFDGAWGWFEFLQGLYFPANVSWVSVLIADFVKHAGYDDYLLFYAGANINSGIILPGMFSGLFSESPPFLTGFRFVKVVR